MSYKERKVKEKIFIYRFDVFLVYNLITIIIIDLLF